MLTLGRFPRVEGNDLRMLRDIDKRSSRCSSPTAYKIIMLNLAQKHKKNEACKSGTTKH